MSVTYFNGIVVGYDASPAGEHALDWAADEAQRRDLTLHVIHVWEPPPLLSVPYGPPTMPESETILDEGARRAAKVAPDVRVALHALPAPVSAAFVDASIEADTVVLGAHGHRRRSEDLGSTAWQVATHALSPVVIVRAAAQDVGPGSPVVVGVDGSSLSEQALEYAFDQADRRRAPLVAVHGWNDVTLGGYDAAMLREGTALVDEQHTEELETWVRPWHLRHPRVSVRLVARPLHPVDALLDESPQAQLVVVGTRGRGGFRGLLLGSVGLDLMHRATCPLAVVRPARR